MNLNILFYLIQIILILIVIRPVLIALFNRLGDHKLSKSSYNQSILYYRLSLFLSAAQADTLNNLGNVYAELNLPDKALDSYRKSIERDSLYHQAYSNSAKLYLELNDYYSARDYFIQAYNIRRNKNILSESKLPIYTGKHKIIHEIEQLDYLIGKKLISQEYQVYRDNYQSLLENISDKKDKLFYLTDNQSSLIRDIYGTNYYMESEEKTFPELISPKDYLKIEKEYYNQEPFYVVIDNFLNAGVLEYIKELCLNSAIWHGDKREWGYLSSYLDDGLHFNIIFDLSRELAKKLPQIFSNHPLLNAWAFKYLYNCQGVLTHADEAIVNLNFWISPDTANLEPQSGGLILYDKAAPSEWDFLEYNVQTNKIDQYLRLNKAKKIIIPYKQNRAVIFNSKLFHASDRFIFKEGYENHRINITLLFGKAL